MSREVKLRSEVEVKLESLKQSVLDGEVSPLNAMEAYKRMTTYLADFKSVVEGIALEELEKHPEKEVKFGNAKFGKTEGGRWAYKHDEEWRAINAQLKEREEAMKAAYKTKGELVVDGEVITEAIYTPNKTGLKISLL